MDTSAATGKLLLTVIGALGRWPISGNHLYKVLRHNTNYFLTPIGVFLHTDAILDWRAEGTFNAQHIRGLGLKGMRVWDFGWQHTQAGWAEGEADIRLLLHATDPDYPERRLGRPASKGCVRIPAPMNVFLDRHGVLDSDYERAANTDNRYEALLLPDRVPTPLAGNAMVVIDTSAIR
jgi:hypothetical protein